MILKILLNGYFVGLITGIIITAVVGVIITKNEEDDSDK